mgnify:CR=1 FL=1
MTFKSTLHINSNEAIAWAAISAQTKMVAHYPGSPVNQVEQHIKKIKNRFNTDVKFNDSLNEHVAALAAAGASFCGARSLLIMKHVGLNIAADPLNYIGYTGVKGGMVIIVGTDPGANSSTGEEDVHWYVPQFNFPLFEPNTVQECYDFTLKAYALSEKYEIPVLVFLPGRLAYNYAPVEIEIKNDQSRSIPYFQKDASKYINVGAQAVKNHQKLLQKITEIGNQQNHSKRFYNSKASIGVITRGLSYSITRECVETHQLEKEVDLLNLDLVYPINKGLIKEFTAGKSEIIFIEDQDGFVENQVKMECFEHLPRKITGKSIFPKHGEISYEQVSDFFKKKFSLPNIILQGETIPAIDIPERLGTFCEGCPHTGSFFAIDMALKNMDAIIGGDIGCSSLPPFRADWLLCMNSGIGISQGMAQVLNKQTIISTGGDGSFFHAGALSLMNAVQNEINLIHLVFDNGTIAMTGHQDSPTSKPFDHVRFLTAMGVDGIIDVSPYQPNDFIEKLKSELPKTGVRVFWVKGACVLNGNEFIESRRNVIYPEINPEKCDSCSLCYEELACPAILNLGDHMNQNLKIDLNRCVRCGVCNEICPNDAITIHKV